MTIIASIHDFFSSGTWFVIRNLALFFVALNLLVDIAQASIDPRIKRS